MLNVSSAPFWRHSRGRRFGLWLVTAALWLVLWLSVSPVSIAAAADTAGPRQCLLEAGKAIDAADASAFERLVDVDAILEEALDIFLREARKPEVARELPPMLAILFSQAASRDSGASTVRSLLLSESRAFVLNGVSSGAFAGREPTGKEAQGLLAPLFANASTGRKEIRSVGRARPDASGAQGWLVPFVVHDAGNGRDYEILGRLSPVENGFRLTSVKNLDALLRRIIEESNGISQ